MKREEAVMSYTLTLGCGCLVYVASHPRTRIAHTRIIERRGSGCGVRGHDIGVRLQLWELLPERDPARISSSRADAPVAARARTKAS